MKLIENAPQGGYFQSMRPDLWGSREGICRSREGILGITRGSREGICFRISDITAFSCVREYFHAYGNIFENAPRVNADLSSTDKKVTFSKISGYVWTGP